MSDEYFIAVKRDERGSVPKNWWQLLGNVEGVTVLNATGASERERVRVTATPDGLAGLAGVLQGKLHVEPRIAHR